MKKKKSFKDVESKKPKSILHKDSSDGRSNLMKRKMLDETGSSSSKLRKSDASLSSDRLVKQSSPAPKSVQNKDKKRPYEGIKSSSLNRSDK